MDFLHEFQRIFKANLEDFVDNLQSYQYGFFKTSLKGFQKPIFKEP